MARRAAHAYFTEGCRKIIGIGRNYKLHAEELGNKVPEAAFWFLKPSSALVYNGGKILVPPGCKNLHYEIELGVFIGQKGKNISAKDAMRHVGGYCVTFDMTARDWQNAAKDKGLPWSQAKGFDTSLPHGDVIPFEAIKDPQDLTIWCKVNGEMRQRDSTGQMVFDVPHLIEACSKIHTLEVGDLILTGTPAGVGPVKPGDVISGGLEELPHLDISFTVAADA